MSVLADTMASRRGAGAHRPLLAVLHEWVVTVDHKRLGVMYVVSGLVFLVVAGLEASAMRLQLAWSGLHVVPPGTFNQLFTMHGTTMVFLVGIPIVFGFGNYLVPLMIGARDLAFPRLNAFGFWIFLFGGLLLHFSFLGGEGLYGGGAAPAIGWFAYAPLTERAFTPGNATDYWNLALLVAGVGTIATAVNMVTTIATMRGPGMTLGRMPIFVWEILTISALTLIILPPLTAAQIMLLLDRFLGAHFFDTQAGASAVMWQHFFWFFGHPEVYILMLPGFGFASEIIPVFSRKVLFGYPMLVAASAGIGLVGMGTWAHHMFVVGMGSTLNAAFAASTMLVAVPTGVKIFNWLGTMYGGKIRFSTPMRGNLLLVPESHGSHAERAPGALAFLAVRDRVQHHVPDHACPRHARHATTDLHLSGGSRLGDLESGGDARPPTADRRDPDLRDQHRDLAAPGGPGGRRPLGRLDARVGHDLAAARLQLRRGPGGLEPAAALGPEASRRSGRSP